jgi:hypothetical protein
VGDEGQCVFEEGPAQPAVAVLGVVEFDAHLASSGQPGGQDDDAAFVYVDVDVRTEFAGVTYARVGGEVRTLRQRGRRPGCRGRREWRRRCR